MPVTDKGPRGHILAVFLGLTVCLLSLMILKSLLSHPCLANLELAVGIPLGFSHVPQCLSCFVFLVEVQ